MSLDYCQALSAFRESSEGAESFGSVQSSLRRSPRFVSTDLDGRSDEVDLGPEFQADLYLSSYRGEHPGPSYEDRDVCVWDPSSSVDAAAHDKFIAWADAKKEIPVDLALQIYHRNGRSMSKAMQDCNRFVIPKVSQQNRSTFKNGFQIDRHRFSVHRMKYLHPHLSVAKMVDLYCLAKGRGVKELHRIDKDEFPTSTPSDLRGPTYKTVTNQLASSMSSMTAEILKRKGLVNEHVRRSPRLHPPYDDAMTENHDINMSDLKRGERACRRR